MSTALIAVVTLLYAGTAVSFVLEKRLDQAIIFGGYALANIGFLLASRYAG